MEKKIPGIALVLLMGVVVYTYINDMTRSRNAWRGEATVKVTNSFINVYSARDESVLTDFFDKFTQQTGIKVNVYEGSAEEVLQRIKKEGRYTTADVFMGVDVGSLQRAKEELLTKPTRADAVGGVIPYSLRARGGEWYGLSKRVFAIFYAKDRVNPEDLSTYLDLADVRWKGRLLVGSSSHMDNQALIASMIEAHGRMEAISWVEGVVANFARRPEGNGAAQLKALAAGKGDIAIASSNEYGRLVAAENPEGAVFASKVGIFFPNQKGAGARVNISGGGVVTSTVRSEKALTFLKFLASEEVQRAYAKRTHEYPVVDGVAASDVAQSWGEFKADEESVNRFVSHMGEAQKIASQLKWE